MKKNKPINDLSRLGELFGSSQKEIKEDKKDATITINIEAPNLGWLFFKDYYHGLTKQIIGNEKKQEEHFKMKNEKILKIQFIKYKNFHNTFDDCTSIKMKTIYPGLTMGTGLTHESGLKGEMKLGLSFDYTTGIPYLPGSSVKGLLRSVFPGSFLKADEEFKKNRIDYIRNILKNPELNVQELEAEIFEGKGCSSIYKRDVFMDALITSVSGNGKFLGSDYITPHNNKPLKNPIPIQFLKILPDVTITFDFKLHDSIKTGINTKQKKLLFEHILKDIGFGAKTNVGYGQLIAKN